MESIKTTSDLVKGILERVPQTRDNDMLLYYQVCLEIDKTVLKLPFRVVILDLKGHGLPSIETVGRCRRKLQRAYPELRAKEKVKEMREVREGKFKKYAKAVNV